MIIGLAHNALISVISNRFERQCRALCFGILYAMFCLGFCLLTGLKWLLNYLYWGSTDRWMQ